MPSILVPIDFTSPSLNAALYAANLAKMLNAQSLTLAAVISESTAGSDGSPVGLDLEAKIAESHEQLEELQVVLYEKAGIPTELKIMHGEFDVELSRYIETSKCDLVVMGVTNADTLETFFGTTHSLEVLKRTTRPILVVPQQAPFNLGFNKKLDIAVLIDDHYNVPYLKLEKWLSWLKPNVHVVHVNDNFLGVATDKEVENLEFFKEEFVRYEPEVHILKGTSFADAVNNFADSNKIEMIFTFPAKHKFFNLLFSGSHTKSLIFRSHYPVLCFPVD